MTDSKDPAGDTETNPTTDDIITVTINVTDVDEDGTVNLSMTQPSVRTEITATLTDPDGGVTGESWVWARTTDPTDLSAHPWVNITNATSASYEPVDGDVNYYLQATVSYTDAEASGKSAKAETSQAVGAGANRAPTFTSGTVTLTVPENSGADVNVGSPVIATDLDAGNTLEYSLEGTDKDSFGIVSDSGQIQTKSGVTYDYETKPSYSVTVKADDGNSGTATKAVTITLTNVEEAGTVRLSPTQPATRQAVTATLTDPDEVSGTPTWQWQRSSDGNSDWTNVGSNSSSYTPPDADLNYYLQATATYADGQGSGKTATAKTVGPVQAGTNRAPTFDDGQTTSRDVAEDAAAIANVGAVVGSTDQDNDSLTYSLTSTDASSFTVDNTGQIKVGATTTLDYESAKNTYTVVVQVTDSKDPAGDTETNPTTDDIITVTINVTDVDEDGTVNLSMTQPSVRTEITATLTDPDGGVTGESWVWARTTDPTDLSAHPWVNITNATSASYEPVDGDVNYYLQATVSYTDAEASGKSAKAETSQAVGAGANRAPTFTSGTVTLTVPENSGADVNVGSPVIATDLDAGNTLEYSLEGTDKDSFGIVSDSGQIQTKSGVTYDYETKPSYSVTVKADDGNSGTATKAVTITLTNVEEAGTVRLSPTQPATRQAVTATLTDPDEVSGTPTWQWQRSSDGNSDWTNVGSNSSSYTPPDADLNYYLQATATYADGQGSGKTATAKTVGPVQAGTNRAPTFDDGQTTSRDVAEDAAAIANVGAVVGSTDQDNDSLTYSLTSTDASSFTVDNTGQIKVGATTTLDYESAKNTYTVVVQVTDSKDPAGDTETNPTTDDIITVTINVTDVDEDGTVNLSMTQPSVRTEITATLTDPDGGVTGESWVWARTTDPTDLSAHPWVNITNATSASYEPVDGDVNYYLQATVSYTDAEASGKSAKAETSQAVGAGANRAPTFTSGTVTLTVPENSGADVNVGSPVIATDLDAGNTLEYSLEGTDKDSFGIVSDSGQIQTKSGVTYDYETKPSYSVTVKADDGNSGTATKAVTIDLTDVDDAGTVAFSTTQPVARTQLTATLTDQDSPVTSTTWVWARSDAQDGTYTDITGTTLATYTPADEDEDKFLRATASYEDRRGPNKTAVAVSANAVGSGANRAPDFGATPATRSVPENSSPGEDVGVPFTATDPDNGDKLTYSLEGTDASYFHIDPDSGQIRTITGVTYDHETKTSYSVTVNVDDGNGAADTIDVVITVTDVNEPPAFLATESGKRTIAENTQANTNIGTPVTATDKDASETLTYRLRGKHAEFFSIDPSFGQLKTHGPLDHETQGTLHVTVEVRDSRNADGNTDTKTDAKQKVEITVTDVNEPPEFPSTETRIRSIVENTGAGQDIGVPVAAVDPDKGASLTYTLGETTDAASFDIVSTSGQLRTKSALDREAEESYTVIVSVHDGKNAAGGSDTTVDDDITVTITVTDVNDPPEFPYTESGARSIAENTASNTNIGSPVRATDADNDNLTYTLEGTDDGSFAIDESSGQLKTKSALDHEDKESYTVTVKASDGNGGVATIDVTITVTDVNEAPDFGSLTATRTVLENTQAGQPVGKPVSAEDQDHGDGLAYSLGGTDSASFGINSSTGQITVGTGTTPDFETTTSYEVTVTATDSLNLSNTITVTIKVTEGNDPPVFATDTATRSVAENTGTGLDIGVPFTATDAEDETLNYTLEGTDAASFGIVAASGQLQTNVALDYEVESSYSVTVKAADAGASGTITVTIIVTDVNEPPLAPGQPGVSGDSASSVSVTWTAPANADRPAIAGYDYQYKKTGEPTWSGATYATDGVVTSAAISGLDASTSYDVEARAKNDEGTGPWSPTGAGSTGNTDPAFSNSATTRDVAENTSADVNIGDPVTATDEDNGDSLTYTLGGGDATSFDIDSKTGQLKTKARAGPRGPTTPTQS